jgi:hypothetical protein
LAPIANKRFISNNLDGTKKDLKDAAKWFVENNPQATLGANGTTIIVNNLEYDMHHMQDGDSIDPILQRLHTALKNNKGESVSHTGAASFLKIEKLRVLKGFFSRCFKTCPMNELVECLCQFWIMGLKRDLYSYQVDNYIGSKSETFDQQFNKT